MPLTAAPHEPAPESPPARAAAVLGYMAAGAAAPPAPAQPLTATGARARSALNTPTAPPERSARPAHVPMLLPAAPAPDPQQNHEPVIPPATAAAPKAGVSPPARAAPGAPGAPAPAAPPAPAQPLTAAAARVRSVLWTPTAPEGRPALMAHVSAPGTASAAALSTVMPALPPAPVPAAGHAGAVLGVTSGAPRIRLKCSSHARQARLRGGIGRWRSVHMVVVVGRVLRQS